MSPDKAQWNVVDLKNIRSKPSLDLSNACEIFLSLSLLRLYLLSIVRSCHNPTTRECARSEKRLFHFPHSISKRWVYLR